VIATRNGDGRAARGERILDAASELLLRFGYSRVTIDDIAQRAEVGKGTVYLHWRTREELFGAVFEREVARALDEVAEGVLADPGSWQLHRVARALFLSIMRRPLLKALFRSDPEVLGKFAGRRERARRRAVTLGEYVGLLSAHGLLREDLPADDLSLAFMSVWSGFILFEPAGRHPGGGGAAQMPAGDSLERRADLLAATLAAAFGSGRAVTADDDEAMRAQVAQWLRRMVDDDRVEISGERELSRPTEEA